MQPGERWTREGLSAAFFQKRTGNRALLFEKKVTAQVF
jgi:hypothetical protein